MLDRLKDWKTSSAGVAIMALLLAVCPDLAHDPIKALVAALPAVLGALAKS